MIVGHDAAALVPYCKLEKRPPERKRLIALYTVFTVGIPMWMPAATMPFREMLGMTGINLGT